jgi:hypothetical protein
MRIFIVRMAAAGCIAILAGCNYGNSAHRDDPKETPGEQAGRAAYDVQKGAKKAAKELAQDLKSFRHDAHEGYQEEKQKQ